MTVINYIRSPRKSRSDGKENATVCQPPDVLSQSVLLKYNSQVRLAGFSLLAADRDLGTQGHLHHAKPWCVF